MACADEDRRRINLDAVYRTISYYLVIHIFLKFRPPTATCAVTHEFLACMLWRDVPFGRPGVNLSISKISLATSIPKELYVPRGYPVPHGSLVI